MLFTDPIIVSGLLTNEEIAIRSSIGFFIFSLADEDERLIAGARLELLRREDVTQPVADVSGRSGSPRASVTAKSSSRMRATRPTRTTSASSEPCARSPASADARATHFWHASRRPGARHPAAASHPGRDRPLRPERTRPPHMRPMPRGDAVAERVALPYSCLAWLPLSGATRWRPRRPWSLLRRTSTGRPGRQGAGFRGVGRRLPAARSAVGVG